MSNLLKETIKILENHNKTKKDIICISDGKKKMTWGDFKKESNFIYASGFGGAEINTKLILIGEGFWLERGEYDGSEWWEFKEQPLEPCDYGDVIIREEW